eukprot:gene39985-48708_t
MPSISGGVVFVSNGAAGLSRALAFQLAQRGFHVLVGVRSKGERASFAYAQRKGLELLDFDMADPASYGVLVQRLRQLESELDRPLTGLLLDLESERLRPNSRLCGQNALLDVHTLDTCHRSLVRGPVRLLSALWHLRKLQSDERGGRARSKGLELPDTEAPANSDKSSSAGPVDLEGLRVVALGTNASAAAASSPLLFQGLLLDLLAGLAPAPSAAWGEARNYSVSLVLSAPQPAEGSGAE